MYNKNITLNLGGLVKYYTFPNSRHPLRYKNVRVQYHEAMLVENATVTLMH